MNSSVAIIGDLDTVTGFQLGGVKISKVVETNEDAENALNELMNEEVSIIIITEKIADNIRKYIDKKIGSNVLPMIIEIPDKSARLVGTMTPWTNLLNGSLG